MLKLILFLSFFSLSLSKNHKFTKVNYEAPTVRALFDVASELFMKKEIFFDVIVCGKNSGQIPRKINKLLGRRNDSYLVNIIGHKPLNEAIEIKSPSIIFAETPKILMRCLNLTVLMNITHLNFLTFVSDSKDFEKSIIPVNPTFDVGHLSQYSYFLLDSVKKMELKTFEWWTKSIF